MSDLTLNEFTIVQNMERIERRMDSLEARWRAFESFQTRIEHIDPVDELERARAFYRRQAEAMRPVMTQEEAFSTEVKPSA